MTLGVHRTHCCKSHGCKYGEEDCPVATGLIKQDYPCENCPVTMEAVINPPVIETYGIDHTTKHAFRNMTIQEAIQNMKSGHVPDAGDCEFIIKRFEDLIAYEKFAYATELARKHLPR